MSRSRGTKRVSDSLQTIAKQARNTLWADFERATQYGHRGARGDMREEAVEMFLSQRIPSAYRTTKGEVVDQYGNRSSQLDILMYNCAQSSALAVDGPIAVVPAEALLVAVEVKTRLNREELATSFLAASKLHQLRPFGKPFVGARPRGQAWDGQARVLHSIFAFESDLRQENWLSSEWSRVRSVAHEVGGDPRQLSRIFVLDRGLLLIDTALPVGKIAHGDGADILLEWFVHVMNFLAREGTRRPPFDWQSYASRWSSGWQRLESDSPARGRAKR
jgi:hypothetical protein